MSRTPHPTDDEIQRQTEALLIELGDSLDQDRQAHGLTWAQVATLSRRSKRTIAYSLRARRDAKLSTIVAQQLAVGRRVVIYLEPADSQPVARRVIAKVLEQHAVREARSRADEQPDPQPRVAGGNCGSLASRKPVTPAREQES